MGDALETSKCRICERQVEPKKTGRPAIYCSHACRRAAEYEIRRANDTITQLEREARSLRDPGTLKLPVDGLRAEFLQSEITATRKRLLQLLADE